MAQSADTRETLPAPSGNAMAGSASAHDPVLYEQMVRPWDLCQTPLEPGEFRHRMWYLKLPGITLYREIFDLRCRLRGLSPADTFAFSVPLSLGARSTYWGSRLEPHGMLAMLPGGIDVDIDSGQKQLVILFESSLMRTHLPADVVEELELAATGHRLPAKREDVRLLGSWLYGLIDRADRTPDMLRHPAVLRSVTEDILRSLVDAVSISPQPSTRPPCALRRQGLDRALEYVREADLENQSIPEISKAAGVSQRTLEYAFRDVFGLTPLGFLKLKRMHAARRDLRCTSPEQTTVMTIAYHHGFYHPSRFARNYRRLFGEQPSVTLARSPRSDGRDLYPLLG